MRDTQAHNGCLLQRVAGGDADAVRAVIDQYGGLVWSLARRFSFGQQDAEDAVQEIFLDLWKSAARYDPSVAGEATFVAMIARRRLIDRRRKAGRQPAAAALEKVAEPAQTGGPPDGERGPALGEEAGLAMNALEQLSSEQQRVLRLSVLQGLSHDRIAAATGLPLGTVKTHIRRGLMRIREILDARANEATGGERGTRA